MRGVTVRGVVLLAGVLAWSTIAAGRPSGALEIAALLLLVLGAALPAGVLPTAALLGILALQLTDGGLDARLPFTVAATSAYHLLCALCAHLPLDARIQRDVWRRPLQRFVAVQALTIVLFACAATVRGLDLALPDAAVPAVTAGLLVAAAVAMVAASRRRPQAVGRSGLVRPPQVRVEERDDPPAPR